MFLLCKEGTEEILNHDIKRHLLGVEQVPFGLLSGRGRTCPARLWMVYGWLWEGRGPGMPGPYRAAIFAAGGCGGMRAVMGRPDKAPQALLRAASSPGRGAFLRGLCPRESLPFQDRLPRYGGGGA